MQLEDYVQHNKFWLDEGFFSKGGSIPFSSSQDKLVIGKSECLLSSEYWLEFVLFNNYCLR